jgi:hypothetical protein
MATMAITFQSATVNAGTPITNTVTFADADLPDILAAYRALTHNPSMTATDIVLYVANMTASQIMGITKQYRGVQNPPPAPPTTIT